MCGRARCGLRRGGKEKSGTGTKWKNMIDDDDNDTVVSGGVRVATSRSTSPFHPSSPPRWPTGSFLFRTSRSSYLARDARGLLQLYYSCTHTCLRVQPGKLAVVGSRQPITSGRYGARHDDTTAQALRTRVHSGVEMICARAPPGRRYNTKKSLKNCMLLVL